MAGTLRLCAWRHDNGAVLQIKLLNRVLYSLSNEATFFFLVTLSIVDTCSISIILEHFCFSYLFKQIGSLNWPLKVFFF